VIIVHEPCPGTRLPILGVGSLRPARSSSAWVLAFFSALLLFFSRQASAQEAFTPAPHNAIHGVVINSVTREPVSRALVYSLDHRFGTLTDEEGHFEFSLPQPGSDEASTSITAHPLTNEGHFVYTGNPYFPTVLSARKPGFLGMEEHSANRSEVQVTPGAEITIPLVPEARIVGHVNLPGFVIYDDLVVQLYRRLVFEGHGRWTNAGSLSVRSNGGFRFSDLEPGTYRLFTGELPDRDPVTADPLSQEYGYPPAYFANAVDFQSATSIELTPGATVRAELTPSRQPYYRVKIPITNVPDQPLDVRVYLHGHKGPGFELGYSGRDRAIEGSLPSGNYLVAASTQDSPGVAGSTNLTIKGGPVVASPMSLVPKSSVRFNVKLDFKQATQAGAEPAIHVYDATAEGVRLNQLVHAWLEPADEIADESIPPPRPPSGPNDDSIVFEGVSPSRYWVRVGTSEGFAAAVTIGDIDLLRKPLTVGLASNLVIDVVVRDGGAELSGTVEELVSNPVTGSSSSGRLASDHPFVYCMPLPDSSGQFRQAPVMPDGKFILRQMPPGSYRVLAFARPQEFEYQSIDAVRAFDGSGTIVHLNGGQKQNLTLHLSAASE
jgi:hypothetical protein